MRGYPCPIVLEEIRTTGDYAHESREETHRIGIVDRGPVNEPVDNCLRNTCNNEEAHTGPDTPLGHYFIHEYDEQPADTDLEEDDE